ncbi:hypothetical protein C8035_v011459 [Colletotrichum spinosum]|uniref:Uncharacterized protein n=1 Tax=Colletotrichum spinosum TaxID=1347390 RepID=A0A4R8QD36_9PEZI|nr:hypothetical protein C8035_v011459 [Colletotrichum spinosum]
MPGQFPKMASSLWSDPNKLSSPTKSAPPSVEDKVEALQEWREKVDHSLAEIGRKLDMLLRDTKKCRELESQETKLGTKLSNSCFRLDSHQEVIQTLGRNIASATTQVHHLTEEIRVLKENEVVISVKPGRSWVAKSPQGSERH